MYWWSFSGEKVLFAKKLYRESLASEFLSEILSLKLQNILNSNDILNRSTAYMLTIFEFFKKKCGELVQNKPILHLHVFGEKKIVERYDGILWNFFIDCSHWKITNSWWNFDQVNTRTMWCDKSYAWISPGSSWLALPIYFRYSPSFILASWRCHNFHWGWQNCCSLEKWHFRTNASPWI